VTRSNKSRSTAGRPAAHSLSYVVDDHALDPVPAEERKSGWALSWMAVGIVTTLVQLLLGGIVTATAGVAVGVVAGVVTAVYGAILGWLVANISYREGTTSTVTSRLYGLGTRGSALAAAIVAFSLIIFLALENVLLYNGIRFALNLTDNWPTRIVIYGGLSLCWVLLSLFGVRLAIRVSSVFTVIFLVLLMYLVIRAGWQSPTAIGETLSHGPLEPGSASDQFQTALALLAGPVGALTMVAADYGRYARSRRDVVILATTGPIVVDIVMVLAGTVVMFGGAGLASAYLVEHGLATHESAPGQVVGLSQSNTGAYFIILSTVAGFALMLAAQAKAQVLNTYSGSLALTTLCDSLLRWRPGRSALVVVANGVGLAMVAGGVLTQIEHWINALGTVTTACAAVMIADYYVVRRRTPVARDAIDDINWAGVATVSVASAMAIVLETLAIVRLGFLLALVLVLAFYPPLRRRTLRRGAAPTTRQGGTNETRQL
jgi:purine-cytosine permease-like protein